MGRTKRIVGALLITATLAVALVILAHRPKTGQQPTQNKSSRSALTAGGVPVPARFQAKARRLGYYCPSWNAAGKGAQAGVCMRVDSR